MLDWIQANWTEMGVIVGAVIFTASRIARLTPTETDDEIVNRLRKAAKVLAIEVPDNPGKPKP